MASPRPTYFLDTSVVLAIVRGKELAAHIERLYGVRSNPFRSLISVVTLGELYTMALRQDWGERKRAVLFEIEQELVVVDINRRDVLIAYAEVSCTLPKGIHIGKNDLWIAATTKASGAILLTTDKDFMHLSPGQIQCHLIDTIHGAPGS